MVQHVRTMRKRGDSSLILWLSYGYTPFSFPDRQTVNQLSASCCYNNRPLSLQFCTFPEESRHTQLTQPTCMVEFQSTCIFWLKHASQHHTQDTETSIPLKKKHLQCTAVMIIDASKTYFHQKVCLLCLFLLNLRELVHKCFSFGLNHGWLCRALCFN